MALQLILTLFVLCLCNYLHAYHRIDWLMLLAYCPLQICWQNCDSDLTGIPPPIFWSLISSRRFTFRTILELVVPPPATSAVWLAWWICSKPPPPYMVTTLLILVWSKTFTISVWVRLTYMVLSTLIWTTCIMSNNYPSNRHILPHILYDFPGTSTVLVCFTHIVLLMLNILTKCMSSYQVYFSYKITPMSLHDISNPAPPSSYLHEHFIWLTKKK